MSDPQGTENETEQNETGQDESDSGSVQGVDVNPEGGDKHIEVDTQERLDHKADAPNFDELPDEELEEERQKRLAPENRPDNVEIDNSQRTFNPETGLFEDSEVDEPPEGAPFATVEGEKPDDSGSDDESDDSQEPSAEEPKDREESTDADQSKEAKESKDTES